MTSRVASAIGASKAAVPALPAGARIDDLEIESVIATTPLAIVYRAYDHATAQVVALKEYAPQGLAARNAKGRLSARTFECADRYVLGRRAFLDEARRLARFRHPSLLRVLDLLETQGTAYRVMSFTPGPTLLEHRQALGRLPAFDDVRQWLDGLLGALAALHREHCIHGAVTPENILLRPGERPLLMGFGTVRKALLESGTDAALEPFDPPPPRRWPIAPGPPRPWSDLYALAVSMHYGVSGKIPGAPAFEPLVDIWRRMHVEDPMPDDLARSLAAIDDCLRADPRQAPRSARLLAPWIDETPAPEDSVTGAAPAGAASPGTDTAARITVEPFEVKVGSPTAAPPPPDPPAPAPDDSAEAPAAAVPAWARPEADTEMSETGPGVLAPGAAWATVAALVLLLGLALGSMKRDANEPDAPVAPLFASAPVRTMSLVPMARLAPLPSIETVAPVLPILVTVPAPAPARVEVPVALDKPAPVRVASKRRPPAATSPRQSCDARTGFALYQCMQTACAKPAWSAHAQCVRLRQSDAID